MIKNKKIKITFIILCIVLLIIIWLKSKLVQQKQNYEKKTISWNSMYPLLNNWDEINFIRGYYTTNNPKIGDLVDYNYAWKYNYIKQVKSTDTDKVEIIWQNLHINWEIMKNSKWEIYKFNDNELKIIWLYVQNWKIPKDSVLIFWDNISVSTDSRKFWAVSKSDLLGKFEIK
jgi:signal peptidase I